ncbi:MAG: thioredoxin fold domain-containing protein, partial [Bdellovibrionales bacterium]|nr:thioredoxin fold domain-containing protein [Bdellovibrionales bacterium]
PFPDKVAVNEIIKLKPIEGHHFNLNAPQKCAGGKMILSTKEELDCQIDKPGKQKVELSVCDDPESFCKTEAYDVTVTAPRGYKPTQTNRGQLVYYPRGERPAPKGFLLNRPDQAIQSAKNRNALLMIDFFGHWCPPCNLFDENVFEDRDFTVKTGKIVKLKLDVDSDLSWELKDKFKVGGYPTIVMVDKHLNEIGRVVGYRPKAAFLKWVSEMEALKDLPIDAALKERDSSLATEEKKRAITLRAAQYLFDREDYDGAISEASKLNSDEAGLIKLKSEHEIANKTKEDSKIAAAIENLLKKYPKDIEAAFWLDDLNSIDPSKAKPFIESVLAGVEKWKEDPKLDEQGYTKGDVFFAEAKIREIKKETDLAKKA